MLLAIALWGMRCTNAVADEPTKNIVVMPPAFKTVHVNAMTWADIQKDLFTRLEQGLIKHQKLVVLNRGHLKAAISELELVETGLVSDQSLAKIGNMVLADWMLISEVELFEVSHNRHKLAFDGGHMVKTQLTLKINYTLIDVASQALIVSDSHNDVVSTEPIRVPLHQSIPSDQSIQLAKQALHRATNRIIATINHRALGGPAPKLTTISNPVTKPINSISTPKMPKAEDITNSGDW